MDRTLPCEGRNAGSIPAKTTIFVMFTFGLPGGMLFRAGSFLHMTIEKIIQELGYKYKEVKVYLAALCLGESNVADIAAKAKMPRTSVSVIIEKLRKDGLLNFYSTRFHKYWVATNPETLLGRLKEKEKSLESIMPELKTLQHSSRTGKPNVTMHAGAHEIKTIFADMIASKQNISGIVAWRDLSDVLGTEFLEDFFKTQREHFLKVRLITPESDTTRALKAGDAGHLRETRFLPGRVPLNTANLIYGNKVAIISLVSNFPTAFLIEDADVHNTMQLMFEKLWSAEI